MTTSSDPAETDRPPSVERIWMDVLLEHGVDDEDTARHLVNRVFATPALTDDRNTAADVRAAVAAQLDGTELGEYLDDDVSSAAVRERLLDALDDALDGDLRGPMSAPRTLATTGSSEETPQESSGPETPGTEVTVPQPSTARAQRGAEVEDPAVEELTTLLATVGAEVADETDPRPETAALVDGLRTTMDEQDLEMADLLRALVWLQRERDGGSD